MSTVSTYAPFRDVSSFDREESEAPFPVPSNTPGWSPFVSVYESIEGESALEEPSREEYAALVSELYDEEFDEALYELFSEGRSLHEAHVNSGHSLEDADRVVTQHFAEIIRESEAMVDAIAREVEAGQESFVEHELDQFVERYAPSTSLGPVAEKLFGGFGKKLLKGVRKVAGKVAAGVKALALKPFFAGVRLLLNPMLKNVLTRVIGKLPGSLQPVARNLAQRLGFTVAAPAPAPSTGDASATAAGTGDPAQASPDPATSGPEEAGSPVQADAGTNVSEMQLEFDQRLAEVLLAADEPELQLELARMRNGAAADEGPVFRDLEEARERFIQDLENLKEGESAEPYVQNFLPAVIPALRIGSKLLGGRKGVVNKISPLLAKVIAKLVGKAQAPALSRAIVDAGLRLLGLEAPEQSETRLASSAVAATVEETMRRVASFPEHVLEDDTLLEGFTLEAFEKAAAANLPAIFSESTYRQRPDLLEGGLNATWVMLPMRRPRYKRCSRTFNVKITPHMAEAVETFEDSLLSDYLQDQLGVLEGEDVEAEVHLFETITGSTAADVARLEGETLGAANGEAWSQLLPLTPEAAEVLLGKPGLGRALMAGTNIRTVPAGQRLYALVGRKSIAGFRGRRAKRMAHVKVVLDCTRNQLRASVYLSEVKAQRLAVRMRQQAHAGSITAAFTRLLRRRLPPILQGKRKRRLQIVHAALPPGSQALAALGQLSTLMPNVFVAKVEEALVRSFVDFVKTGSDKFLAAAQDPSEGVTLKFTIEQPPGLKEVCGALAGKGGTAAQITDIVAKATPPSVRLEALPGHKCD